MIILAVLLSVVAVATTSTPEPLNGSRIIGGKYAIQGQFPWQGFIYLKITTGYRVCGGVLISNSWMLSSANCLKQLNTDISSWHVRLGCTSVANGCGAIQYLYAVNETILHPEHNNWLNYDVALVQLKSRVDYTNYINYIFLPAKGDAIGAGKKVLVSGLGRINDTDENYSSNPLKYVELTTISNSECKNYYGSQIVIDSTLCAVGNPYESICDGDFGGPMFTFTDGLATLHGISSFVPNEGCATGAPSGYVRVESILDWIDGRGVTLSQVNDEGTY